MQWLHMLIYDCEIGHKFQVSAEIIFQEKKQDLIKSP